VITPDMTLRAALAVATRALAAAGVDAPRPEARHLLMSALECDLTALVRRENLPLGADAARANALLVRRAAREPLSRILGRREFHGLDFALGPETLDPRGDTEVLVEAALAALAPLPAPRLLDLGTGTGAILLALLHARPEASGIGIDIAAGAAQVAAHNAARLGLGERARFLVGDLFTPLTDEERFDAILSNPPYIPSAVLETLEPEVRLFDPARALDGGVDGLDFYRRIIKEANRHLVSGGLLAFEVGVDQAEEVAALLRAAGFGAPDIRPDLSGIARVVLARSA
jgi:release factor glutamine methyltransferase